MFIFIGYIYYTWKNIQFQNTVFMYNELTKENLNLVCNLPEKLSIEIFGTSLKIVHGSPKSVVEQIHEKDKELIDKYAKELQEGIEIEMQKMESIQQLYRCYMELPRREHELLCCLYEKSMSWNALQKKYKI